MRIVKKTRDYDKSRSEILKVAFNEIFRRGYQGVSIDEIVKKTSLTKGALYHHFPTKIELVYALVEDVIEPLIIDTWIRPLESFENPLDGILIQMRKLIKHDEFSYLKLGCPLNNLVQEMSTIDRRLKLRLQTILKLWIDELEVLLRRAKKKQVLKPEISPQKLACFIVMNHEGIFGMMRGLDNKIVFKGLVDTLGSYFETLGV